MSGNSFSFRYRFGFWCFKLRQQTGIHMVRLLFNLLGRKYRTSFDGKKVVILAPHPDDEAFGCGGLIARLCRQANYPHVIILSGGECSLNGVANAPDKELLMQMRAKLTTAVSKLLGLPQDNIHRMYYPDGQLLEALKEENDNELCRLLDELQVEILLVPHRKDALSDHVSAYHIGRRYCNNHPQTKLYAYCVWVWYLHAWGLICELFRSILYFMTTEEYAKKQAAIEAYTTPLAPCGEPWSGALPPSFLRIHKWKLEVYVRVEAPRSSARYSCILNVLYSKYKAVFTWKR